MKKFTALSITIASSIHKLSLSLLLATSLINPIGAQENNIEKVEIVRTPTVNNDRVKLRIKVTGEGERPVMGLSDLDFKLQVDEKPVEFKPRDWKSPEEAEPPPAWIIILLDMSGSMASPDSSGKTKLAGGIEAIHEFIDILADRGGKTQVAIVPFGEGGANCEGYQVKKEQLDKFFAAGDFKLKDYLDYLGSVKPCASTNLYEPLEEAIDFLANRNDTRFYLSEEKKQNNPEQPEPRLSIILLSDGYHNRANEAEDFEELSQQLQRYDQIIVHTLGYGLTPQQLQQKYKLSNLATREDVFQGKVPQEEFVDRERLAEIAQLTGGISEFSGDAEDIAENLRLFLNALLGEYEIIYTEPNPERGSTHEVIVEVGETSSEPKSYRIKVFGRSLPFGIRLLIFVLTLVSLGLFGILPFYWWGRYLQQKALEE